jgi:hypothetical protein
MVDSVDHASMATQEREHVVAGQPAHDAARAAGHAGCGPQLRAPRRLPPGADRRAGIRAYGLKRIFTAPSCFLWNFS